uniref:Uncharacterized protein n=1 Tax=Nelumbo nucifera TaxID=4432 RepID=A0A822Z6W9_NELNU|nr:TPA_asm: hypothetical protein HUJ06_013518 [Nelumbo nucifera]
MQSPLRAFDREENGSAIEVASLIGREIRLYFPNPSICLYFQREDINFKSGTELTECGIGSDEDASHLDNPFYFGALDP